MNRFENIIADVVGVPTRGVAKVLELIKEGATIPFISRYRKEQTGSLDETQIEDIVSENGRLEELEKRKVTVLSAIEGQGKLTDELRNQISGALELSLVEDLYLPYKQKRKTRAVIARDRGLEPLAKIVMSGREQDINSTAKRFCKGDVVSIDDAIAGAKDIIAEWVSENIAVRAVVRALYYRTGALSTKVIKSKESEADLYKMFFDWNESIDRCVSHRVLAMLRAVNEGYIRLSFKVDKEVIERSLFRRVIKDDSYNRGVIEEAIVDSLKRLISPSIEREILSKIKEDADRDAGAVFATNLKQLLMFSPLGEKRILAIDPGIRTGCKVVCLNEVGDIESNSVIYPFEPKKMYQEAIKSLNYLIEAYKIEAIAIGNGTAGRETERLVGRVPIVMSKGIDIFSVSEDGASVYSASKLARKEFPQYDVTVRGAISIGRRLMDPLAELVKIDPKSLGIGQYQHDIDQKLLQSTLDRVVESAVNSVGVNVNTASEQILTYISGIGPALAKKIVETRESSGGFNNRLELKRVSRLSDRVFQQCAGFLRIEGGSEPIDTTTIHPESYGVVRCMAKDLNSTVDNLKGNIALLDSIVLDKYVTESVGMPTLIDIIEALKRESADPRDRLTVFKFDDKITKIDDIKEGDIITGVVTNITNFGAFVDLGIKENGLIHISEMGEVFISNPADVVSLQERLTVKVKSVDRAKRRIGLTLKGL